MGHERGCHVLMTSSEPFVILLPSPGLTSPRQ